MQQLYHYHEIPLHVAGGDSFPVVLDILGEKRVLSLEYPHLNLITFLYSRSFFVFHRIHNHLREPCCNTAIHTFFYPPRYLHRCATIGLPCSFHSSLLIHN